MSPPIRAGSSPRSSSLIAQSPPPQPWSRQPLPRSFYTRGSVTVARELLGKILVHRVAGKLTVGRIVEVEAYRGTLDPASHAYRGRTARNDVMFRQGGHLYVYFTYGMHFCCNVVTGKEGRAEAVLIRAVEPLMGIQDMAARRGLPAHQLMKLCSGPGRLCEAFGIERSTNGADLCGRTIWLEESPESAGSFRVHRTARVGIRQGKEHLWRFLIVGSPFLSPGRPAGA